MSVILSQTSSANCARRITPLGFILRQFRKIKYDATGFSKAIPSAKRQGLLRSRSFSSTTSTAIPRVVYRCRLWRHVRKRLAVVIHFFSQLFIFKQQICYLIIHRHSGTRGITTKRRIRYRKKEIKVRKEHIEETEIQLAS